MDPSRGHSVTSTPLQARSLMPPPAMSVLEGRNVRHCCCCDMNMAAEAVVGLLSTMACTDCEYGGTCHIVREMVIYVYGVC